VPPPEPPAAAVSSAEDAAPPSSTPPPPPAPGPANDTCVPVAAAFEASLRPKLKKCWLDAANKKKDTIIIGEVKYVVDVDGIGKIAGVRQTEETTLPDDVIACMTKAVKAEKFDTSKCTFKTLTVEEKFPR
jgi:hypothetical protein